MKKSVANVRAYCRFARVTLAHKWYVWQAGRLLGVSKWRLLVHDFSKFSATEMRGYAKQFYGADNGGDFKAAWRHHYTTNSHHPEYWRVKSDAGVDGYVLGEMPADDIREMVADWFAASKAYDGAWPTSFEAWKWWNSPGRQKTFSECSPRTQRLATWLCEHMFTRIDLLTGDLADVCPTDSMRREGMH